MLLMGVIPQVHAQTVYDSFVVNGVVYTTTSDNTVAVTSNYYGTYSGDITIPATVTHTVYSNYEIITLTFKVTSIEDYAFSDCSGLTSITLPSTLRTIGSNAFYGCTGLTSVTIPNGVESINSSAFQECTGLRSVVMPNTVTSIGDGLFYGCTSLTNVQLSSSIKQMSGTFFGCTSLTSIEVPYSVTTLYRTFAGCSQLANVVLHESLATIDNRAFEDCAALTSLYIPNSVTTIGEKAFNNSGLTSLEIPCTTTQIKRDAFLNCTQLMSVTSRAITPPAMINSGCFSNETYDLASLYVPNIVKDVYQSTNWWSNFNNIVGNADYDNVYDAQVGGIYYHITGNNTVEVTFKDNSYNSYSGQVTIPSSVNINRTTYQVTGIGCNAFKNCSGLTGVTIPASVTTIGDGAFEQAGLTSVTLPGNLLSIGTRAFKNCTMLTSLTIPESVKAIGESAFSGCSGITALTWNAINCPSNGNLYTSNINQVTIGSQVELLPDYFVANSKITQINIPESVVSIGYRAFYNCDGFSSLTIPVNVTHMGAGAFGSCYGVTSLTWNAISCPGNGDLETSNINTVVIGDQVEMLPSYFVRYSQISSVSFPASVKQISDRAFEGCNLPNLLIPETIESIGPYAFSDCYITNLIWNAEYCDNNGDMNNGEITQVTIGDKVKILPHHFCYGSQITSVSVPSTVDTIGNMALRACDNLVNITVASANTHFDSRNNCNAIIEKGTGNLLIGCQSTIIPNTVTTICESAFYSCNSLTDITIPNSVTSIEQEAFYQCTGLTNVTISKSASLSYIGYYAFGYCNSLASFTIPANMTEIYDDAFYYCSSLNDVYSYVTDLSNFSVAYYAFYRYPTDPSSRTVHVPAGMVAGYTNIGAFSNFFGHIVEMEPIAVDPGDADGDGVIGMDDLTTLINYMLNSSSSVDMTGADVDQDSDIDMDDLACLINYLLTGHW